MADREQPMSASRDSMRGRPGSRTREKGVVKARSAGHILRRPGCLSSNIAMPRQQKFAGNFVCSELFQTHSQRVSLRPVSGTMG